MEGLAKLFQFSFFLKTFPHAIIEMPKLSNAINAAKPCIKPPNVGGVCDKSVGNMPAKKIPIEKILKVMQPVADALPSCNKLIKSKVEASAST